MFSLRFLCRQLELPEYFLVMGAAIVLISKCSSIPFQVDFTVAVSHVRICTNPVSIYSKLLLRRSRFICPFFYFFSLLWKQELMILLLSKYHVYYTIDYISFTKVGVKFFLILLFCTFLILFYVLFWYCFMKSHGKGNHIYFDLVLYLLPKSLFIEIQLFRLLYVLKMHMWLYMQCSFSMEVSKQDGFYYMNCMSIACPCLWALLLGFLTNVS